MNGFQHDLYNCIHSYHINSLKELIKETSKLNLNFIFGDKTEGENIFDTKKQLVKALNKISKEDLLEYYKELKNKTNYWIYGIYSEFI